MAFYDLNKDDRAALVAEIQRCIQNEIKENFFRETLSYCQDEDTYIRKSAYLSIGRIYFSNPEMQAAIADLIDRLFNDENYKVRQTAINAAGEIGKIDFYKVQHIFDQGLFDPHHVPRNSVIGSIKKMGEINPKPILAWAKNYLHHENKEIRREICHGIELRGRKYPQDILPLLKQLQNDNTARVRTTLVHVIGQIAYKKGCLVIVVDHLKSWENKQLVADALNEIIDVHDRYRNFAAMTQDEARKYLEDHIQGFQ